MFETLEDDVLLATAQSWCDDCSWDKKWDCSYFYAIMRDGTFQGSFVEKDECLAAALKRMPELPQRVIYITFHGSGCGPTPDDGYIENTHVASYRLDGEADWPGRLERILATKKKERAKEERAAPSARSPKTLRVRGRGAAEPLWSAVLRTALAIFWHGEWKAARSAAVQRRSASGTGCGGSRRVASLMAIHPHRPYLKQRA